MGSTARAIAVWMLVTMLLLAASEASASSKPPGGVYARHALAIDAVTGETLFEKNPDYVVPIASITKLMTALVVRETGASLDSVVTVTKALRRGAGKTRLRVGERVRGWDLLHLVLMASDNYAARELAAHSGLAPVPFVARMNEKAEELGLRETHFVEVTGLRDENVSTVRDVAGLLRAAAADTALASIMTKRGYEFTSESGRLHKLSNTNRMVYDQYEVKGGKTGHIGNAGYCVVTWLRDGDQELIAVVLGSVNYPTLFNDVRRILRRVSAHRDRSR